MSHGLGAISRPRTALPEKGCRDGAGGDELFEGSACPDRPIAIMRVASGSAGLGFRARLGDPRRILWEITGPAGNPGSSPLLTPYDVAGAAPNHDSFRLTRVSDAKHDQTA